MKNAFPGFSSPAVGMEAPIEMLAACHERVTRQCATLRRLVPHLQSHGADAQAQTAATGLMRYFDTSAIYHHQDEELDLFPALVAQVAPSERASVGELTDDLARDHRTLEAQWKRLRAVLAQIAEGTLVTLAHAELEAFVSLYERHIAREEALVLPLAVKVLGEPELAQVGRAMRARRGLGEVTL